MRGRRKPVSDHPPIGPIRIDWRHYFREFCALHGEPILFKGRFLFRDGWRYANDYKGPIWGPAEDERELALDIIIYHKLRISRLNIMRRQLRERIEETTQLLLSYTLHGIKPQYRKTVRATDAEGNRTTAVEHFPVTTQDDETRLRFIDADIAACEAVIAANEKLLLNPANKVEVTNGGHD